MKLQCVAVAVFVWCGACGSGGADPSASNGARAGDAGVASDGASNDSPDEPIVHFASPPPPCVDEKCANGGKCVAYSDDGSHGRNTVCVVDHPCNHLRCPRGTFCGFEEIATVPITMCFRGPEVLPTASETSVHPPQPPIDIDASAPFE